MKVLVFPKRHDGAHPDKVSGFAGLAYSGLFTRLLRLGTRTRSLWPTIKNKDCELWVAGCRSRNLSPTTDPIVFCLLVGRCTANCVQHQSLYLKVPAPQGHRAGTSEMFPPISPWVASLRCWLNGEAILLCGRISGGSCVVKTSTHHQQNYLFNIHGKVGYASTLFQSSVIKIQPSFGARQGFTFVRVFC